MPLETAARKAWAGKTETREDRMTAAALSALAATLDRDDPEPAPGSAAPPLSHWLCFNPAVRQGELGADGHPKRGGFLPPVALPRRMWAGGRLAFHHPLRVGDEVRRDSRIVRVDGKEGRSGALVFVTVRHEIANAQGVAIVEEHDIVYRDLARDDAPPAVPVAAARDETFVRHVVPDAVLLFRYSALTFNGHRIHYDRRYVTEIEGYPGLIVHGPLVATLLLDLLRREVPDATVTGFAFKAVGPLFDLDAFDVCGRPDGDGRYALWARDHDGRLAMQATADVG